MKACRKRRKPIPDVTPPETSPAAERIAHNIDLLTQILLRVPAKSLIPFKSVSKPWLSLISDPQFASTHSRLNPNPFLISSLYFYHNKKLESVSLNGTCPTFPSLSFLRPLTRDFTVLHSCNGLILIRYGLEQVCTGISFARYAVCNPTTQKYRDIGGARIVRNPTCCLAFDPTKSPHYRVVLFSSAHMWIDIYSSDAACWKRISLPNKQRERVYGNGAFWNGSIYWLGYDCDLLRYDVETEKMIESSYKYSATSRILGACGDRLLLIQSISRSTATFKICEMDKDEFFGCCRWNVKFLVDLKSLISEFPEMESKKRYKFAVLCVVEGEKQSDSAALILAIPEGKIISYNLHEKTWHVLGVRNVRCVPRPANVFPFVESLSPL